MQRLLIVYNPRSSRCLKIREEVLEPLTKLHGYQVGKFEIKDEPVEDNINALAQVLVDGDLVILAGGDGTATVGLNAAMRVDAEVTLGVLGYGNFNDFSRMLGRKDALGLLRDFENGSVRRLFPLEVFLDGKIWRYAACYVTMGMFAESTEIFDKPKTRESLRKGKKGLIFSLIMLVRWYFQERKRKRKLGQNFLPKNIRFESVLMNQKRATAVEEVGGASQVEVVETGRMDEDLVRPELWVSDVMFVNGKTVARLMKGGDFWIRPQGFLVSSGRFLGFFRLCKFMLSSMFFRISGRVFKHECRVNFAGVEEFELQAEGEYMKVKAREVVVRKNNRGVKVV